MTSVLPNPQRYLQDPKSQCAWKFYIKNKESERRVIISVTKIVSCLGII